MSSIFIVGLTILAMHNCEHFVVAMEEYGIEAGVEAESEDGNSDAQDVIALYYDMCRAGLKDEIGPLESFECIYPGGTVASTFKGNTICQFNIGEEG